MDSVEEDALFVIFEFATETRNDELLNAVINTNGFDLTKLPMVPRLKYLARSIKQEVQEWNQIKGPTPKDFELFFSPFIQFVKTVPKIIEQGKHIPSFDEADFRLQYALAFFRYNENLLKLASKLDEILPLNDYPNERREIVKLFSEQNNINDYLQVHPFTVTSNIISYLNQLETITTKSLLKRIIMNSREMSFKRKNGELKELRVVSLKQKKLKLSQKHLTKQKAVLQKDKESETIERSQSVSMHSDDDDILVSDTPFTQKDTPSKDSKAKAKNSVSVGAAKKVGHSVQQSISTYVSAATTATSLSSATTTTTATSHSSSATSVQHKKSSKARSNEASEEHHSLNTWISPLDKEEERYMTEGVERFGTNWKKILDTYPFSFYDEKVIIYHWKNHLAKLRKSNFSVY